MTRDKKALSALLDTVIAANAVGQWNQGEWRSFTDEAIAKFEALAEAEGEDYWEDYVYEHATDVRNCDTAFCVAGWKVEMDIASGLDIRWSTVKPTSPRVYNKSTDELIDYASGYAQETLGLSDEEANILFEGTNTLPALKEMFDVLIGSDAKDTSVELRAIWEAYHK